MLELPQTQTDTHTEDTHTQSPLWYDVKIFGHSEMTEYKKDKAAT